MKKWIIVAVVAGLILAAVLFGGYIHLDSVTGNDKFHKGVFIDNIDMSKYNKEQATNLLNEELNKKIDVTPIKISSKSTPLDHYSLSYKDIGYKYDIQSTVEQAYNQGREGSIFEQFFKIRDLEKNPINYTVQAEYDKTAFQKLARKISEDLSQEPEDASFEFVDGNYKVIPSKDGRTIDETKLAKDIEENFWKHQNVNIPMEIAKPKIETSYFAKINGVIGEFTTNFKGSAPGRIQNIKLASSSFNKKIIMPGEEVSYNKTTGPLNAKNGYKEAPVIIKGELTPGMGGGVCQSSTTLYNALLLAGVEILERHPHSMPASYVPKGTDGAVAPGFLDLKFKNSFDYPIYLDSKIVGNTVTFYVYGDALGKKETYKITTDVYETRPYKVHENLDLTLEPGTKELVQEGRTGYKVRTYKSTYDQTGKFIKRELISHDYYRERDYIYKVRPEIVKPTEPIQPVVPINPENPITPIDPITPIEPEEPEHQPQPGDPDYVSP